MTSQLGLYNRALMMIGERSLASLTENREPRRLLDSVWQDGAVNYCLEEGQWYFAMRSIQIDPDPNIGYSFGYHNAYTKPSDWVLTCALCSDEFFRIPLTQYSDEAGFWWSDINMLFVRYVSNDQNYGNNMSLWPETFKEMVAAYLAMRIAMKLTGDATKAAKIEKFYKDKKIEAKNRAHMADATMFSARGTWANSRNRFPNRKDGGNLDTGGGNLIG